MGRLKTIIAFAIAGMMMPGVAHAATVTITGNYVAAGVRDYPSSPTADSYSGTSIATSQSLHDVQGGNISDVTIDYSVSGAQTTLLYDFKQARTGGQLDYSLFLNSSLYFTVDANTSYELSGYMNSDDIGESSGIVYLYSYLQDLTVGNYIFQNLQQSRNTEDESFTLGLQEGDYDNILVGAITGQLMAGHDYKWYSFAYIQSYPSADDGATAVGNLTLKIGAESAVGAVPLPPAFALFMPGLALLGFFGMRGKRSAAA